MASIISMAFSAPDPSREPMKTRPSSSMSMSAPVRAMISLIRLPFGPITSPILSTGTCMVITRGALAQDRHTGFDQGGGGGADARNRRRAVRLQDVGHEPQGVWDVILQRDHRNEGPFGERTVPDLPSLRTPDPADLAGRERREVVVMDVALRLFGVERVDHLGHAEHPEGGDVQNLGLAPLEQAGAMGPRHHPHLAGDGTDLVRSAAVQPKAVLDDPPPHEPLLQLLEGRRNLRGDRRVLLRAPR